MASLYIGVYKALYDFQASTDEELSIAADDLLYLLEKSEVDDWWTVKKRVVATAGEDVEEPAGLIPSNYVEPAPPVQHCSALYDYDKQTEEELSFKEGDQFEIYDLSDPDWLLAGNGSVFGFIPSNYITYGAAASSSTPAATTSTGSNPITQFAPPPMHRDRVAQQQAAAEAKAAAEAQAAAEAEPSAPAPQTPSYPRHEQAMEDVEGRSDDEDEDEAPPPMPSRPQSQNPNPRTPQATRPQDPETPSYSSAPREPPAGASESKEHGFDGEFFRWYIDEVDGRKKRPIVLAIGNGLIIMKPDSNNPKKLKLKSASSLDNNWRIRDLTHYNHEKKHVFMDFQNPEASIELHAGTKDVAEAIVAVLGDLKGAEAAKGLSEVARAASTKTSSSNRRVGKLLFDFKAQGSDELSCKEHDEVYIVDSSKSKDWWLCERKSDGRQGVVPSSYIEIVATTNLDRLTDGVQRRKSQNVKSSKGKVVEPSPKHHRRSFRSRDDRDKIRESDKRKRDRADTQADDAMPNYHRVRTWIDSSGTFKVEAEFLGFTEGKVHLHKTNGVKIAVAATKLSIEDLEYVEKVTDNSLEKYKEEVTEQLAKREKAKAQKSQHSQKSSSSHKSPSKTATAVINDVPPPKPNRANSSALTPSEPDYDWFEFFLSCGVDLGNCQRYSVSFSKEQMDESILEDITPSLLRSLGLREGDILRVMKHLDSKFDRKKTATVDSTPTGGLFTEASGALKNNSTTELSKVNASALPDPSPLKDKQKSEDDAWAVKPAARSSEDLSKTAPRPQYTGSLQDLVDIKPVDANKPLPEINSGASATGAGAPSAPTLTPVKTGPLIQPNQEYTVQKTGSSSQAPLGPVRTGGLIPVPTGGLIPVQPTGFTPITAQPTGFVPIQQVGVIGAQPTFSFVPLQTGVSTFAPQNTSGGPPPTSFGQVPMQPTSSFVPMQPTSNQTQSMPQTSFGQAPMFSQATGGNNGMMSQTTGGLMQNAFVPQSTFGKQITGGFMPSNTTGGMPPQTSFGTQHTGGMMPQTSFGNQATGGMMPQTSFGNQATGGMMPQTSFGGQATGGMMPSTSFGTQITGGMNPLQPYQTNTGVNQLSNMFQNTSLGGPQQNPQQTFGQPNFAPQQQTGQFGQPNFAPQQPTGQFGQPMNAAGTGFGAQSFGQQPTSFGQQNFGQPNQSQPFNSFGQQQPPTSFGQQGFEGFGTQPLQSQPTGLGFGNAPNLQAQATGRRANLQAATADNPFGF